MTSITTMDNNSVSNSETNRDKKFSSIFKVLEGKNDPFLSRLKEIHKNCCILWQNAPEYDFDPADPGNGIRSIIQMINFMFDAIARLVHHLQVKHNQQVLSEWETLSRVFLTLTQMNLLLLKRNEDFRDNNIPNDSSVYTEIDQQILIQTFAIKENDIRPLYSLLGLFWLRKGYDKEYKRMITMISLAKCSGSQVVKLIFNNDLMISHLAKHAQFCSISGIRKGLDVFTKFPFKTIANMKWNAKGTAKHIIIPKQQEWKLLVKDSNSLTEILHQNQSNPLVGNSIENESVREEGEEAVVTEARNGPVEAEKRNGIPNSVTAAAAEFLSGLVIGRENSFPNNRTVILHMHGGAFVACTPHHHANYLRVWSKSLGIPIICPDYAKAPERPFPDGLQDALDTYLFLTSGDERVVQILGFQPENVILSGDSAGGWHAVALSFILCDLVKEKRGVTRIKMPTGIVVQYPAVNLSFGLDPSHGIAILNPMLTASLNALCLSSFAKRDTNIETESWSSDPEFWKKIPPMLQTRIKDPLFNLLSFKRWNELEKIPLFVTACEYDSLLDGAISLCKSWKGAVKLDIARGVDHGFLFMPSEHIRMDFDRVIDQFRNCLSLVPSEIQ